jgi:hypothetical protein
MTSTTNSDWHRISPDCPCKTKLAQPAAGGRLTTDKIAWIAAWMRARRHGVAGKSGAKTHGFFLPAFFLKFFLFFPIAMVVPQLE